MATRRVFNVVPLLEYYSGFYCHSDQILCNFVVGKHSHVVGRLTVLYKWITAMSTRSICACETEMIAARSADGRGHRLQLSTLVPSANQQTRCWSAVRQYVTYVLESRKCDVALTPNKNGKAALLKGSPALLPRLSDIFCNAKSTYVSAMRCDNNQW